MLQQLLERNPWQRATAAAALTHPWLAQHCGQAAQDAALACAPPLAAPVLDSNDSAAAGQGRRVPSCFGTNNVVAIPLTLGAAAAPLHSAEV